MKVIIAGTRYKDAAAKIAFDDYGLLIQAIGRSGFDIQEVVCGCAIGADKMGEQWASSNDKAIRFMPADWTRHGKAAGPIRNRKMAEYADAAIILWDGKSPGSRNMIDEMIRHKKPYYVAMTVSNVEDFI